MLLLINSDSTEMETEVRDQTIPSQDRGGREMVQSTLLIDPLISAALEGDQLLGFKPQSDLFTGTFHRVAAMDDVPV